VGVGGGRETMGTRQAGENQDVLSFARSGVAAYSNLESSPRKPTTTTAKYSVPIAWSAGGAWMSPCAPAACWCSAT
jgi:hypothetical protein